MWSLAYAGNDTGSPPDMGGVGGHHDSYTGQRRRLGLGVATDDAPTRRYATTRCRPGADCPMRQDAERWRLPQSTLLDRRSAHLPAGGDHRGTARPTSIAATTQASAFSRSRATSSRSAAQPNAHPLAWTSSPQAVQPGAGLDPQRTPDTVFVAASSHGGGRPIRAD